MVEGSAPSLPVHLPRLDPRRVDALLRALAARYEFDASGITARDVTRMTLLLSRLCGDRRRILMLCVGYLRNVHGTRHGNAALGAAITRIEMYIAQGRGRW